MSHMYWILDGHTPVPSPDVEAWSRMFQDRESRRVAIDTIGDVTVSTVFLGINHSFDGLNPPILFETMVFGLDEDMMERYSTWEQAEEGHRQTVEILRAILKIR